MQLINLELEGFGKFSDKKSIDFKEGINFISGLNETGKSTILEAVIASIFKFNKREIEPFFCWNNPDVCKVSLTYKTDDGEIFRILSDYKNNRRKLEKITNGNFIEISPVDKIINPYLKDHFGFDDKKVFENTAFIRQSQMTILEDALTKNKIKDMIEEVFAGRAEGSATKTVKKIKKVSKDNFKKIEILKENRLGLKEKLENATGIKSNVSKQSEEHKKISVELTEKQAKSEKLQKNKTLFDKKQSLSKEAQNLDNQINQIDEFVNGLKGEKQEITPVPENKILSIILITIGLIISLVGFFVSPFGLGAIAGMPIVIYGIYKLLKKSKPIERTTIDHSEKISSYNKQKGELINKKAEKAAQLALEKYKLVNFTIDDFDELDDLKKEVENLKNRKIVLQTAVKTTTSLIEDPNEIEEKLNVIDEKIEELENKIEDHNLAAKFLEIAETQVYQKFTPTLEQDSKPILKNITNNHYEDLKIDEETLDIAINVPEIQEYVDTSLLSQGARDQVYFTLRTVMVNLLSGDVNVPLILDDPFHNFDEIRLKKTIEVVNKISEGKQIILISHRPYHNEFDNFTANVIELK